MEGDQAHPIDEKVNDSNMAVEVEGDDWRALMHTDADYEVWHDGEVVEELDDCVNVSDLEAKFPFDVVLHTDVREVDVPELVDEMATSLDEAFTEKARQLYEKLDSLDDILTNTEKYTKEVSDA